MLQRDLAICKNEVVSLTKGLEDKIKRNQAFEEEIVELNQKIKESKKIEDEVEDLKAQLYESKPNVSSMNDEIIKLRNPKPDSDLRRALDVSKDEVESLSKELQYQIEKKSSISKADS